MIYCPGRGDKVEVEVTFTAQDIEEAKVRDRWAVVIDVLRATTTITTALGAGCRALIPTLDPEEARLRAALWARRDGRVPLLGGERRARPIPGFDLGNSPPAYVPERVAGKVIFFTTTNGTQALRRCGPARITICACLRNAEAVARYLTRKGAERVLLACAGREGAVAPEDVAVAGKLALRLERLAAASLSPAAREAARLAGSLSDWPGFFARVPAGRSLLELGYEGDVTFCAQPDVSLIVPRYARGAVVKARWPSAGEAV